MVCRALRTRFQISVWGIHRIVSTTLSSSCLMCVTDRFIASCPFQELEKRHIAGVRLGMKFHIFDIKGGDYVSR